MALLGHVGRSFFGFLREATSDALIRGSAWQWHDVQGRTLRHTKQHVPLPKLAPCFGKSRNTSLLCYARRKGRAVLSVRVGTYGALAMPLCMARCGNPYGEL